MTEDPERSGVRRFLAFLKGARTVPRSRWTARQVWRPTPGSLVSLLVGLWLFGTGEAFLLTGDLGASPWTVLAQGLSIRTGWDIGWLTFLISLTVLLLWIPLRQRPGLGTVLNILVIPVALQLTYDLIPTPSNLGARLGLVVLGIATIGLGSGFYLTAGPRTRAARRLDDRSAPPHRATGRADPPRHRGASSSCSAWRSAAPSGSARCSSRCSSVRPWRSGCRSSPTSRRRTRTSHRPQTD